MEFIESLTLLGITIKSILNYFFKDKINETAKTISEIVILLLIVIAVVFHYNPVTIDSLTIVLLKGTFVFGTIYGLGYIGQNAIKGGNEFYHKKIKKDV